MHIGDYRYIGMHIVFHRILSKYSYKHSRVIGDYCTRHAFVAYTLHDRAGSYYPN